MIFIFYDPATGKIKGFGSDSNQVPTGLSIASSTVFPNYATQKIDTSTGELINKTEIEISEENSPTMIDVRSAIEFELFKTDRYVMPDRDDIAPELLISWTVYRKTLRDLSKGTPAPTVAQMIDAWPLNPNGDDAILQLRNRM